MRQSSGRILAARLCLLGVSSSEVVAKDTCVKPKSHCFQKGEFQIVGHHTLSQESLKRTYIEILTYEMCMVRERSKSTETRSAF